MPNTLKTFLLQKGYTKIKLSLTETNHCVIKVSINNNKGVFILDTGASNSCVDFNAKKWFNMKTKKSEIKMSGASGANMKTKTSKNNTIKIGKWKKNKAELILIDLSFVNKALTKQNTKPINGIIGADILKKGKGIIDYKKKHLYLRI